MRLHGIHQLGGGGGGAGADQLGQAGEILHVLAGDDAAIALDHGEAGDAAGVGRRLPEGEGPLLHDGDGDGIGIAPHHVGAGDPVQRQQTGTGGGEVGAEDGLVLAQIQRRGDGGRGGAAFAADMDAADGETGIGADRIGGQPDAVEGAAQHAGDQKAEQQGQHGAGGGHGKHGSGWQQPRQQAALFALAAADRARLHLGQFAYRARALTGNGAATVFAFAQRSHEASSTIQRHNLA